MPVHFAVKHAFISSQQMENFGERPLTFRVTILAVVVSHLVAACIIEVRILDELWVSKANVRVKESFLRLYLENQLVCSDFKGKLV